MKIKDKKTNKKILKEKDMKNKRQKRDSKRYWKKKIMKNKRQKRLKKILKIKMEKDIEKTEK